MMSMIDMTALLTDAWIAAVWCALAGESLSLARVWHEVDVRRDDLEPLEVVVLGRHAPALIT